VGGFTDALLRHQAYVGGQWVEALSGATFEITNPADGGTILRVPDMGADDAVLAIAAAADAWTTWRERPAAERARLLRAWFDRIVDRQEDLARLMTLEQGKPLAEARGEVVYGASFVEWFAEEARRTYGEVIPAPSRDRRFIVIHQPVGVVAAITPWNFPLAMITRKCAPALAAGCTVVVKPSELTPLCALALADLAQQAGLPDGVFNIITTTRSAEVGRVLTASPVVRKLSFTGSTAVGKLLLRDCAETVKKVSLELGGNAPFIVFDDADVDEAVRGAVASKYRNSGQTCVCANRLLVQKGIYDAFATRLGEAVKGLTVGNGFDDGVAQGPLINSAAVDKVERHIADALDKGASLVCGGRRHALGGTFFEPTVLRDVDATMAVAGEETFGPVAPLFRFSTESEAVELANATTAGLAGYFYSRDIGRVWRVAEALEYGMVGINTGIISTEVAPFGGVKESGLGREGARQGIGEYLETKYLCMGGL